MRKLVEVTLKDGRIIDVFDNEISGLKKAGVLKEDKSESFTKEEKETGETKEKASSPITTKNIKGGRPKKVR